MTSSEHHVAGKNVIILCHSDKKDGKRSAGSGPIEPLLKFFTAKKARYIFIVEQPHPSPRLSLDCTMEVHKDGILVATHTYNGFRWMYNIEPARRLSKTYIRLKLRDMLADRHFFKLIKKHYPEALPIDFVIGMESINTLMGHFYRKLLQLKGLVYYTFDWTPTRYDNPIMNSLFLWLDKTSCQLADFAWNTTDTIADARRNLLHYDLDRMAVQVTVPYGAEFRADLVKDYDQLEKFKVIYSGGHYPDNGAQFLPDIAKRVQDSNPRVKFILTGEGPLTGMIRAKEQEYGLRNIELTGYVATERELDKLMCQCVIGLAPYADTLVTTKRYGDGIKMRTYLACGLVVVSTVLTPTSREVKAENLGIVTQIDATEMADAILRLCGDESLMRQCRENVIRKAKAWGWTPIFSKAFSLMSEASSAVR